MQCEFFSIFPLWLIKSTNEESQIRRADFYTLFICSSVMDIMIYTLGYYNNVAMFVCAQVVMWTLVFIFLGYAPRSIITGSYSNSLFNILRSCQSISVKFCCPYFTEKHLVRIISDFRFSESCDKLSSVFLSVSRM